MSHHKVRVATLDELQPGSMRQVTVAGTELLLARVGDEVFATGARCVHYGAPLAEGVLHGRRVVCPWHHAVFDVTSGRQLEPPGCGDLQRFPVRVDADAVWVTMAEPAPAPAAPRGPVTGDAPPMVLVGAGAAGAAAAVALREQGYTGRIVLLSRERRLPYDRTLLSKEVLQGTRTPCPLPLHPAAFYRDQGIELRLGCDVRRLDAGTRTITFADGATFTYDQCLVATGGIASRLGVPGMDLPGVFTLRSWEDADRLVATAASARRAVIVGSSFIGLECAASLRQRGIAVTVVTPEDQPFAKLFGERVSAGLMSMHKAEGIEFLLGEQVARFEGQELLQAVETQGGARISADLAVVGIGIKPSTDFLAGVDLADDGGLVVDEYLQVTDGLFAAGDIAAFPVPLTGERARIEHWRVACEHGRIAARNMLGQRVAYTGVPFFWSAQKLALYYVGHADAGGDVTIHGDPGQGPFIAYYSQDGNVTAALGVERNAAMAALHELARIKRLPSAAELVPTFDPVGRLGELAGD